MYRLSSRRKKRLYSKLRKAYPQSLSIYECDLSLRRDDKKSNVRNKKIRTNPRFRSSESVSSAPSRNLDNRNLVRTKGNAQQIPNHYRSLGVISPYVEMTRLQPIFIEPLAKILPSSG